MGTLLLVLYTRKIWFTSINHKFSDLNYALPSSYRLKHGRFFDSIFQKTLAVGSGFSQIVTKHTMHKLARIYYRLSGKSPIRMRSVYTAAPPLLLNSLWIILIRYSFIVMQLGKVKRNYITCTDIRGHSKHCKASSPNERPALGAVPVFVTLLTSEHHLCVVYKPSLYILWCPSMPDRVHFHITPTLINRK